MRGMNLMIGDRNEKIWLGRVIIAPKYDMPPSGWDPRVVELARVLHVPLIKVCYRRYGPMVMMKTRADGVEYQVDVNLYPGDLLVNRGLPSGERYLMLSLPCVSNDDAVSLLEGAELHETCVIQFGDGTFLTDCPGDCGLPSDECSKWIYKTKDILKAKCFECEGEAQKRIQYRNLRGCKIMPRAAQLSFRSVY